MTAPTTNLNTEAADLLDAAALRIERYGHCKGAYYPQPSTDPFTSPCCVTGALRLSAGFDPYRDRLEVEELLSGAARPRIADEAEEILREYLDDYIGHWDPVAWNDADSTTKDQVIDALRGAARGVRAS